MNLSSTATQKRIHDYYWRPLEERLTTHHDHKLQDVLHDFLKNFLSISEPSLRDRDIYHALAEKIGEGDYQVETFLIHLTEFSTYYQTLLSPELEKSRSIRDQLLWLNRLGATSITPTLLRLFHHTRTKAPISKKQRLSEKEFLTLLQLLESLLIRRFLCQLSNTGIGLALHNIFKDALVLSERQPLFDCLIDCLNNQYFPNNQTVSDALLKRSFSSKGIQGQRVRYLLMRIEAFQAKPVPPSHNTYSLEHIMPYSLTNWWKKELGDNYTKIHTEYLSQLGNITLVPYRATLSNRKFPEKKVLLAESNFAINAYFKSCKKWKSSHIKERTKHLRDHALNIWKHPTS